MNLHQKLLELVREERRLTHEILRLIARVETEGLHLEMGYSSIFAYLTKGIGYCESSAYRRMQAARLLKELPAVSEKLVSGAVNLTQLSKLQGAAKSESFAIKKELLEKIEKHTKVKNLPKVIYKQGRIALNTNLRKVLFEQNNYECQYTSADGKKCGAKYFLEIEHIKPLTLKGSNEPNNLTVLCRAHNQYQARKLGLA